MGRASPVDCVIVLGSGLMAPGIARARASTGARVVIAARNYDRAAAVARSAGVAAVPLDQQSLRDGDLVIETITEDREAKRDLYEKIEGWFKPTAILASNTSSLALAELAERLSHPEQFIGFHFLNPAELTPIAEIVPASLTSEETIERVTDFARRMGKRPLVLRHDVRGFIWNRIQFAVLRECLYLLERGVADADVIDAAVADGLAPRWMGAGPLATAQLGGLETFRRVAAELFPDLAKETTPPARLGRELYSWDEARRDELVEFRREAIDLGAQLARRRP